jgi:hypothetical protein
LTFLSPPISKCLQRCRGRTEIATTVRQGFMGSKALQQLLLNPVPTSAAASLLHSKPACCCAQHRTLMACICCALHTVQARRSTIFLVVFACRKAAATTPPGRQQRPSQTQHTPRHQAMGQRGCAG